MGFRAAYVSASCLQQSQLYCCRRFGGGNLQLMFSLRSATEKAIISSHPDSAQKVFVAVVSEYGLALGSRQAVIGQLGQHYSRGFCSPNQHGFFSVHADGVDARSEMLTHRGFECKGHVDFGCKSWSQISFEMQNCFEAAETAGPLEGV
jgi:hypothetical protein